MAILFDCLNSFTVLGSQFLILSSTKCSLTRLTSQRVVREVCGKGSLRLFQEALSLAVPLNDHLVGGLLSGGNRHSVCCSRRALRSCGNCYFVAGESANSYDLSYDVLLVCGLF